MVRRKILAVTGARSEYDLLYTVYKALAIDERFDFSLVICGPHLSEKFGFTARHVQHDDFEIADYVFNLVDSNQKIGRIISIGNQIPALAQTFYRIKPDMVLVAGDREEAISATMTGAFMDIPVAHFFGGDIAKDGNIDNSVRYAATKFAHLHFPSLPEHKKTLLSLGEDEWRISVVGNPALDRFLTTPEMNREELGTQIGREIPDRYNLMIYHSIITEVDQQHKHVRVILEAVRKTGVFCFLNFPNSDPGNTAIIEAYQEFAANYPAQFGLFQNIERTAYVNLLRHATCLIGNSSSGLLEAPSLGLPAINIGPRQKGRIHGQNVIFTDYDESQILNAYDRVTSDSDFRRKLAERQNPYGDGKATEKIIDVLAQVEINRSLIYKNITY